MKRFIRITKWTAYACTGMLLLALAGLQLYKIILRNATEITTANGISMLEEITLGGVRQWIFIRGTDQSNPVLIFLHGGPGSTMGGMASSRTYDAELIKHATVVHWDQRGAGKSFNENIPVDSMSYASLVEDCHELIDYLRNRFNIQKVFIVGHSAGSITGMKAAHAFPDKIHAYIGVAQIINEYKKEKLSYHFALNEAVASGDASTRKALMSLGQPPYDSPEKEMKKARYIVQYGGFIHDHPMKQLGVVLLSFLTSPEYTLVEGMRAMRNKGLYFSMHAMWPEIQDINLTEEIQSIQVPVYFFEGKYDMIAPSVLVENYYNTLVADKGKELIMFENSAHVPMLEEKEKYENLLIAIVQREHR